MHLNHSMATLITLGHVRYIQTYLDPKSRLHLLPQDQFIVMLKVIPCPIGFALLKATFLLPLHQSIVSQVTVTCHRCIV